MLQIYLYLMYIIMCSIFSLWIYLFIVSVNSFLKVKSLKSSIDERITPETSKSSKILSRFHKINSLNYDNNIGSMTMESISFPFVSVIVPARNEEREIERCLVSILKQNYPNFEVIAIDDCSTDSTYDKMKKVKEENFHIADKLTVLSTADYKEKPKDWFGKTWVSEKAFEKSKGDIILFTDADSNYFDSSAILVTVSYMIKENLDVLGGLPYLRLQDLFSKIVMPLWNLLSILLANAGKVNDPSRIDIAYLLGSYFLIKRDTFIKIGTYNVVKDAIQEDFDLALVLKQKGYRLRLVKIDSLVSALWSRDASTLWQGVGRTIVPVAVRNIKKILHGFFNIFYMATLPFIIYLALVFDIILFHMEVPTNLLLLSGLSCSTVIVATYIKGLIQYKEKKPLYAAISFLGAMFLIVNYLINLFPLMIKKRKLVKWRARIYEFKMYSR
jgi:chlorobactene glucosyltransferase